ncbi:MAG: hypothetical protein AB7I04_16080 [Pseudomonadales bacterium]
MKRLPLILIIAIPLAAVLMGAVSLYLALQGPDQEIPLLQAPLTKTSWQQAEEPQDDSAAAEERR